MKKLGITITFAVIGVLISLTLIAGLVKISFLPTKMFNFENITTISVSSTGGDFSSGLTKFSLEDNKETYTTLKNDFKSSFEKSFLTSLFDGSNNNEIVETKNAYATSSPASSDSLIRFTLKDSQTYVYEENDEEETFTYNFICVSLNSATTFQKVTIYLVDSSFKCSMKLTTIANTCSLNTQIDELCA